MRAGTRVRANVSANSAVRQGEKARSGSFRGLAKTWLQDKRSWSNRRRNVARYNERPDDVISLASVLGYHISRCEES